MNNRTPPFDKLAVRQAVNYAIDRNALVRLYGGLATPTENVLPPTYPQYKKHALYPYDLAKAKQLIKDAGATGTAVTVWGSNRETSRKPVEYLADVLNKIGLKAKLEDHRRARSTGRRSATRRRRRRSASPTGSRTTRTRSTGSTCC